MASENDVIINPDPAPTPPAPPAPPAPPSPPAPAPAPTPPAPAPAPVDPATNYTPDQLQKDFALAVKAVRGISTFLPANIRVSVDRFLIVAEAAQTQPWVFEVAVAILNRFQGQDIAAVPQDQMAQAMFEVFIAKGEQAKPAQA